MKYKIVERQGRRTLYEFEATSKAEAEDMYVKYMALCGAVLRCEIEAEVSDEQA